MKCHSDDEPFEISHPQIKELIQLASFTNKDVFCDLGCASGKVVIEVRKHTKVKLSKGIDVEECQFCKTWPLACRKLKKSDLWKIDFELAHMDTYDYSDATVLYYSMDEALETMHDLQKRLRKNRVRIITKDLPFVGYLPNEVNRKNKGCWFFLTEYPCQRVKDLDLWIESVLGKPGDLSQLYRYYRHKLNMHYPGDTKYHEGAIRDLKKIIRKRFDLSKR